LFISCVQHFRLCGLWCFLDLFCALLFIQQKMHRSSTTIHLLINLDDHETKEARNGSKMVYHFSSGLLNFTQISQDSCLRRPLGWRIFTPHFGFLVDFLIEICISFSILNMQVRILSLSLIAHLSGNIIKRVRTI